MFRTPSLPSLGGFSDFVWLFCSLLFCPKSPPLDTVFLLNWVTASVEVNTEGGRRVLDGAPVPGPLPFWPWQHLLPSPVTATSHTLGSILIRNQGELSLMATTFSNLSSKRKVSGVCWVSLLCEKGSQDAHFWI